LKFSKLNSVLAKTAIKKMNKKITFLNSAIFNFFKIKKESVRNIKSGTINLNKLKILALFSKLFDRIDVSMPIGARLKIK